MAKRANNHDQTVVSLLEKGGALESVSSQYIEKLKNMFGASYETVLKILKSDMSKSDCDVLIALSPMIVRSMTSKDNGVSDRLFQKLNSIPALLEHSISGKANRTVIRLLAGAIIFHADLSLFNQGSLEQRALVEAKKVMTVYNTNGGSASNEAMNIVRESQSRIGVYTTEVASHIAPAVALFIKKSSFGK